MSKKLSIIITFVLLSGCGVSKHEVNAWKEVRKAEVVQQGFTDRELIRLRKSGREKSTEEGRITILPSPAEIPMITTTVINGGGAKYVDELGEVEPPETKTITTKVDTTALAIMELGKVAVRMAPGVMKPTREPNSTDTGRVGKIERIVYQKTPMPKSNAAEVIEAIGKALSSQGWIGSVFKTFFLVQGAVDLASTPSHIGDTVTDSNNPITTKKTTTTTHAAE